MINNPVNSDNFNSIGFDDTQLIVQNTLEAVKTAVCSTMGPNGNLALISIGSSIKTTKDGVTVAKAIKFENPKQEIINRLITEPAVKTDDECGDGTTTTIFLTSGLYELLSEYNTFSEQRIIEEIIDKVILKLDEMSIKVDKDSELLFNTALTSSNHDEIISKVVTDIFKGTDKFPQVELKEGISHKDVVSTSQGLPLQMKFSNPIFSGKGQGEETTITNVFPYIVDNRIANFDMEEVQRFLEGVVANNLSNVLLVARSVDNEVVQEIARFNHNAYVNNRQFKVTVCQTNMGGSVGTSLMQDIAIILGTKLISGLDGWNAFTPKTIEEDLVIGSNRSLIKDVTEETQIRINERIESIKSSMNEYEGAERFSRRARFNEQRIRDLSGELITIHVGGDTISDVKERLDRYEDVIKAVRSAIINGVLPGVGTSLAKAGQEVVAEYLPTLAKRFPCNTLASDLLTFFTSQYNHLVGHSHLLSSKEQRDLLCINLVTNEKGKAEDMGIYDTAYSSITALKGGFKTAQILSKLSTLMLGDKLSAVKVY